jgi:hypothetical protein
MMGLSLALLSSPVSAQPAPSEVTEEAPIAIDLDTAIRRGHVQRVPVTEKRQAWGEAQQPQIDRPAADENDPPALLDESQLGSLKNLGIHLSSDRNWMRPEIMKGLDLQDLMLDEIFTRAPSLVSFEQQLYQIQIEKLGPLWENFDPRVDPFVVFLTHEIFDDWGEDRALGFMDGGEMVVFESDLDELPALAITLVEPRQTDQAFLTKSAPVLTSSFELGEAELRLTPDRLPRELLFDIPGVDPATMKRALQTAGVTTKNTCTQEVAPTSCSGGKPVCPSGYAPYFVLDRVLIKQDHEGLFKGSPEIELFPLRIDVAASVGSNTTATTNLLFSGRTVTDMAGRSRYLPDVNNTNTWYTVTNGVAIFPANNGLEFSALLVEEDDDAGVLRIHPTTINITKLWKSVNGIINDIRAMDYNFLFKLGGLIFDIIAIFDDGDDLYQESIGVANNLVCTDSLGQMKSYYFNTQEWSMYGHFACVNPACPDPGTSGGGGGGYPIDPCGSTSVDMILDPTGPTLCP